jgi:hypothetical protein
MGIDQSGHDQGSPEVQALPGPQMRKLLRASQGGNPAIAHGDSGLFQNPAPAILGQGQIRREQQIAIR